jgi:hypothetical protein
MTTTSRMSQADQLTIVAHGSPLSTEPNSKNDENAPIISIFGFHQGEAPGQAHQGGVLPIF